MTFDPSYFLAAVEFNRDGTDEPSKQNRILEATGREPSIEILIGRLSVELLLSPSVRYARSVDERVLMVQHGELYEGADIGPEWLLDHYVSGTWSFVNNLNGSFALLVVDGNSEHVTVATDRISSRKVFSSRRNDVEWLSTFHSFRLHPAPADPDPAGVAHYLANGIPLNGRTLVKDVRILERASVHTLDASGWSTSRYWDDKFLGRDSRPDTVLRDELGQLLIEAVRRRATAGQTNYVSLSAGYDSLPILGALHRLGEQGVNCFSYEVPAHPGLEAKMAREAAARVGYSHQTLSTGNDGLIRVLDENAKRGQGLARLVIETDLWRELARELDAKAPAAVWVGDEVMGYFDCDLRSGRDALARVGILGWHSVRWLERFLPRDMSHRLRSALEADLSEILSRVPDADDWHDVKDFLYLDQRVAGRLTSWREAFLGSHAQVRIPLFDNDILDFVRDLPVRLRRDKRLWRETGTWMFPNLLAGPRPQSGSYVVRSWGERALGECESQIRELLNGESNPMDELCPPGFVLKLLERQRHPFLQRRYVQRAQDKLRRASRQIRYGLTHAPTAGTGLPPYFTETELVILLRALLMRRLFAVRADYASRAS